MESEKKKILGTVQVRTKEESVQIREDLPTVDAKETIEYSHVDTSESFLNKYKGYIIGIALLLVIACIIIVPRISTQPDMVAKSTENS